METRQLEIEDVFDAPLVEVSGLGLTAGPGGNQVMAVGDNDFTVLRARLEDSLSFEEHDLKEVLEPGDPSVSSEWEAADGDSSGRVFILQESPGKMFVLSPGLDELLHTIDLNLDTDKALDWNVEPNAQGEGLVLLANGHVLVAKEKDPPLLLEFGMPESGSEGVEPELLFSTKAEFPVPDGDASRYEVLNVWRLGGEAAHLIKDVSDVAVGPDDRLYLLSDESRLIARLEPRVSPGQNALHVTAVWKLPEELKHPEGLILDDGMVPFVAIDTAEPKRNVFRLSSLT